MQIKNKKRIRLLLSAVFLLFIFSCRMSISSFAAETPASGEASGSAGSRLSLSMDVTYGYENTAKDGRILPVTVKCTNGGNDFSGDVEIRTRESDLDLYNYIFPVSIPAGETKTLSYWVPIGTGTDQIYVCMKDSAGKQITGKRVKLNISTGTPDLFIGLLSDNPDALNYLDNISINYGQLRTRIFRLEEETFPENEEGLDQLDVILISDYRIRNLNTARIRALMQWVQNGGVMILGTGSKADDTLGRFAPELLDDAYDDPELTSVDLNEAAGTQISGNNTVSIPCINVSLHGGRVVLTGSGIPLLSAVNKGKGMIAVSAFDFVDISEYAGKHSAWVNSVLSKLLGTSRMDALSAETYGTNSGEYWSAQSLISTGENSRIPDMDLYIIAIIAYILLIGPGLYLFLKGKNAEGNGGREVFYGKGVLILSVCFTAVIYLMGSRTRFRGTFYDYATILDSDEDSVSETTYLNLRNPYNTSYQVNVKPDYSVLPLTKAKTSDSKGISLTGGETDNVEVLRSKTETSISVADVGAFSSKFFRLKNSSDNTEGSCFSGNVNLFENGYSGTVTNHYPYAVKDAAILFYGKIIPIGDMAAGESKSIDSARLYNIPLNSSAAAANLITGSDPVRRNLLSFYMENILSGYTADARMIAFPAEENNAGILENNELESSGITLLSSTIAVNSRQDKMIYRSALLRDPTVLSGDYMDATNSTYAGEPVVLEYSLGNDVIVDHVDFEMADPVFLNTESENRTNLFAGTVSLYNYSTGNFDETDISKGSFSASELSDYISPGNTISIRYVPSGNSGGINSQLDTALPMLTFVGEVKG